MLAIGDRVWYDPDATGLMFSATVRSDPSESDGIWLVELKDLPSEYREYMGGRTPPVVLALADRVFPRAEGTDRGFIHWNEYLAQCQARSAKMTGVAEEVKEDPGR